MNYFDIARRNRWPVGWCAINNEYDVMPSTVKCQKIINSMIGILVTDMNKQLCDSKVSADKLCIKACRAEMNRILEKNGTDYVATERCAKEWLDVYPEIVWSVVGYINGVRNKEKNTWKARSW